MPAIQLDLFMGYGTDERAARGRRSTTPKEWRIVPLRECPMPHQMELCDCPQRAADYWRRHIEGQSLHDPERECLIVLLLNTRRRVRGHQMVTVGTVDTILVHPREVYRIAIVANAAAIVVMHNHPSGEPEPSEADIRATRDLLRAGQILRIELLDHIIIGRPRYASLKELGFLYPS